MASINSEPKSVGSDDSSDDECLSVIKSKVELLSRTNLKKTKSYAESDSDEGRIMTDMMVTVEVEELDDTHVFNFDEGQTSPLDMSKKKKRKKKNKLLSKNKIQKKEIKQKVQRLFTCRTCESVFNTTEELKTHSLEHQVKTRHYCEECNRYFKKAFSLRIHKRGHMGNMVKCPICEEGFPMPVNLGKHLRTMHTKDFKCDKCPEKFFTQKQLDEHNRKHDRERHLQTTIKIETSETYDDSDDAINSSFEQNESFTSREDLSHPTQCAIVTKMHKGRSVADICRIYNLKPEIVEQIWEEREKYTFEKKAGKQTIRLLNNMLDSRIIEWFEAQRANDVQVSGQMLQDVAETFAKECGFVAFNGSKKWLDRFKSRYNILLRGTPRKKDPNASASKWKNIFFSEQWCDVRMGVADEDIYCADEVGFYYRPSKGRVRKLGGKKYIQGHAEDRLVIFLCANAPGTDKKKLFVCGTEDPLIRSHRDPNTLPVDYIRHSQAHFTTQMFEEYVRHWNRELQMKNKKALLVLDRVTIHSKLQLSHLKLVFVPWKACNTLIPIKFGIFNRFRDEYRRVFLEEKAINALKGIDRNFTCLEALYMLEKAWDRTPAYVINSGFIQTGYDIAPLDTGENHTPKVTENDEEMFSSVLRDYDTEPHYHDLRDTTMYLTVDEELITGQGTNCSVFGGNHKVIDPLILSEPDKDVLQIGTEKPDSNETEEAVTRLRAMQDLDIVKKYLYSSDTSYENFCLFMDVERFLKKRLKPIHFDSKS